MINAISVNLYVYPLLINATCFITQYSNVPLFFLFFEHNIKETMMMMMIMNNETTNLTKKISKANTILELTEI